MQTRSAPGSILILAAAAGYFLAGALTGASAKPVAPPIYDCRGCGPAYGTGSLSPPAHFDPLAASDLDLASYGFPPRPDASADAGAYAFWKRMVTAPAQRVQVRLRASRIQHGPLKGLTGSAASQSTGAHGITSTYWNGYAIDDNTNKPFAQPNTSLYGEFVVPYAVQAFGTCNGTWDYSSPWVGFDGVGNNDVLQAGMDVDAMCSGGTTTQNYAAWYEWYPAIAIYLDNFPINAGDVMYVYLWPSSSTVGNYYFLNETANLSAAGQFDAPTGTSLVGNSVEWIEEWFSGPMITNYVDLPMYDAQAVLPDGTQYSAAHAPTGTVYSVTLEDSSHHQLARTFLARQSGLTYVDPSQKVHHDAGSFLLFQTEGIARGVTAVSRY